MEQAYATCETYSDTGTSYQLHQGKPTHHEGFRTEFSRDGYLWAEYLPGMQKTVAQKLLLDQGQALTINNNTGYRWPTQEIALKAYVGDLFTTRHLLKVKGANLTHLTNWRMGSERLPDANGALVVKAFWMPAEVRAKHPSSAGTYEKFQIDPETFLVRQSEFFADGNLYSRATYQPQINRRISRQALPDRIEPGFTDIQEQKLTLSNRLVARYQKAAQELAAIKKQAPAREQKLRDQIQLSQELVAYFAQKVVAMEEGIFATYRISRFPDFDQRRMKFIAVKEEALRQQVKSGERQQKLLAQLEQLRR